MYRDVVDVVEQAGHRLDTILIPKVGVPADVYMVDALVTQIEEAKGIPHRLGIDVLIETALGMANVEAIAQSEPPPRGDALRRRGLRGELPGAHGRDRRPQPRLSGRPVARGALAHDRGVPGLRSPADRRAVRRLQGSGGLPARGQARGAALGIEGKWAIHPSQIALANEVFSPPPAEVDRARRILVALEEAAREGRGAAQLDGRMIDAASARMAQNVVDMAEAIDGRADDGRELARPCSSAKACPACPALRSG